MNLLSGCVALKQSRKNEGCSAEKSSAGDQDNAGQGLLFFLIGVVEVFRHSGIYADDHRFSHVVKYYLTVFVVVGKAGFAFHGKFYLWAILLGDRVKPDNNSFAEPHDLSGEAFGRIYGITIAVADECSGSNSQKSDNKETDHSVTSFLHKQKEEQRCGNNSAEYYKTEIVTGKLFLAAVEEEEGWVVRVVADYLDIACFIPHTAVCYGVD